jgi:hypothetical protein
MGKPATALILAIMLTGCAHEQVLPPEALVVQKVVAAPQISKEQIFEKSRIWFARTFRQSMSGWWEQNSTRTLIQYENEGKGVLIANGAILYPHAGFAGEGYKRGWEVRFTLETDIREGQARVTFSNLTMFVPSIICGNEYAYPATTSSYETPLDGEELARVKPVFLDLADRLGAFLKAPEEKW